MAGQETPMTVALKVHVDGHADMLLLITETMTVPHKALVTKPTDRAWWKSATVYQVYPASYASHSDTPTGTLQGILKRLPYLRQLGVDVLWLSPIYDSPQADMGYDISDYKKIDKQYGSLQDWDELKDECHKLGMKLVMDLVVNHTSDQHGWFKEARSSKTNPKRDWYIWRPASFDKDGNRMPPNNWKSCFGPNSAWEWDEETQEYYLHLFLKEQPDLNWENAEVRNAVWKTMRWWLDRGADGFRMDVINFISKAPGLPDAPTTEADRPFQFFGEMSINRPGVHTFLKEMHQQVLRDYDCFAVGECPGDEAVAAYAPYSQPASEELQMVFHFHHQGFDRLGSGLGRTWDPQWKLSDMKKIFNDWQVEMERHGGWNSNYLENHDQPRIVSRLTSDHHDDRSKCAKLCALFHTTLTGTIFIYQGQEIGMINVPWDWKEEEYKDVESMQNMQGEREHRARMGLPDDGGAEAMRNLRMVARDNGRTPMQWDSSPNAGFSKGSPWMRVHDDFASGWNVAAQVESADSPYSFWQRLISLRKEYESMVYGKFVPLDEASEEVYAYLRIDSTISQTLLVVLNLARGSDGRGAEVVWDPTLFGVDISNASLIISNNDKLREASGVESGGLKLGRWEGRMYLLS